MLYLDTMISRWSIKRLQKQFIGQTKQNFNACNLLIDWKVLLFYSPYLVSLSCRSSNISLINQLWLFCIRLIKFTPKVSLFFSRKPKALYVTYWIKCNTVYSCLYCNATYCVNTVILLWNTFQAYTTIRCLLSMFECCSR